MINKQITALLGVFTSPKQTMQQLPSNRLYALAILAPLYFSIARAFHPRNHAVLYEKLGGNLQVVLLVCVAAAIMIPLGAWIMRQILKLFSKRLTVIKILNISGYARVPRLVVAAFAYIVMFANPSIFAADRPSPGLIAIIVLGVAGMVYTTFLTIYGFVVCPTEEQTGANNALQ